MNPDQQHEAAILESWHANVQPWVRAVREGQIESRRLATDTAIVAALLDRAPRSVLDIGCGEGWLARALAQRNIRVVGIDAVAELVQAARQAGAGEFHVLDYAELAKGRLPLAVDAVVCNFSLLGDDSTATLLGAVHGLLNPGGCLVVQTLHPLQACADQPYGDGWREGSWQGFSADFHKPAPWYFRTLESWIALFSRAGLHLRALREPLDQRTGRPASVIFIAVPATA